MYGVWAMPLLKLEPLWEDLKQNLINSPGARLMDAPIENSRARALTVRIATELDAEAILRVHYAAVHEFGARSYGKEVLDEWSSPVNEERILALTKAMVENPDGEIWLLAEGQQGILGFGSIVPRKNELRACYVAPNNSGLGAGKAILDELEALARKLKLHKLQMDASVNAESFYLRNGYRINGRGHHLLRSGRKMKCVFMSKILV